MLTAKCQVLCDGAHRASTNDAQVHDPQEFNPVSSMTSVTLQGWCGGVVFARNVQHWPIRQEGESGYTPGEDRWLARRTRIRECRNGGAQAQPWTLYRSAECEALSDQAADFCKIED